MIPFVRWPGGLYRVSKRVARILPEHDIYVEPFAGGLSVLWNKPQAKVEVIADSNATLIRFYDAARRGALKSCKPVVQSEETFNELKSLQHRDACAFVLHNRMAYDGSMVESRVTGQDGKLIGQGILSSRKGYEPRLRKAHLRIADYKDTMRKFDSPTTLHVIDPPWVEDAMSKTYARKKYGTGHSTVRLKEVIKTAQSMQGKVVIVYFDSPESRKLFRESGMHIYRVKTHAGGKAVGREKRNRLVVTNFKIPDWKRRSKA